jgi:hypothetical protein
MNDLLTWLGVRHHRYLSFYVVFALCALVILSQQAALAWPLTQLQGASDLTVLSSLADQTLLTRLVASTLDYGVDLSVYLAQIRLEEVILVLLAVLLVQKTEPYSTPAILRVLLSLEILLTLGLALILNLAFNSTDTLEAVTLIRSFGWVYGIGSVGLMAGITLEGIRLCFLSYSD